MHFQTENTRKSKINKSLALSVSIIWSKIGQVALARKRVLESPSGILALLEMSQIEHSYTAEFVSIGLSVA
jgi:hypothetical protein